MGNHLKRLRVLAFHDQAGHCFYCRVSMWESAIESQSSALKRLKLSGPAAISNLMKLKCTAEHLIRRSDGGPTTRANIRAACFDCNCSRESASVQEHVAARRAPVTRDIAGEISVLVEAIKATKPRTAAYQVQIDQLRKLRTTQLKLEVFA